MTDNTSMKIGIVILAAGGSSRFGEPKQLLKFNGTSLLRRATETALASGFLTVVVLGSNTEKMMPEISGFTIETVENAEWQQGISSSIRLGLSRLIKLEEGIDAVIFMLCDQPFVTSKTLQRFIDAYLSTKKPIIASEYNGTLGVPALFDRTMFPELGSLTGDTGAKYLIRNHAADVHAVPAPEAATDIDRPGDYSELGQVYK